MLFNEKKIYQLPGAVERMRAEEAYFAAPKMLSYSGIKKLADDPVDFYRHYVLNIREDRHDKSTLEGSLTHMLLFNPDDFDKEFAITPATIPSDNPKKILHTLFDYHRQQVKAEPTWSKYDLLDYSPEILEIMINMNVYQNLKLDSARIEKVNDDKGANYWDYLVLAEGKKIIDTETKEKADYNVEKIKSNAEAMRLMGMIQINFGDRLDVLNEKEYIKINSDLPFGYRGFLDNLVVDHANKEIRINDLKNTSKSLLDFRETIEFYRYWIQVCIYHILIENIYGAKYPEYTRVFRFIVLDKNGTVGSYRIKDETVAEYMVRFENLVNQLKVHFEKRDFSAPAEILLHEEIAI